MIIKAHVEPIYMCRGLSSAASVIKLETFFIYFLLRPTLQSEGESDTILLDSALYNQCWMV